MSLTSPVDPHVASGSDSPKPLILRFGGSLVEQLGAQLYPSVTATVAELISNSWDADASTVWVTVPFDEDWKRPDAEIVVLDDGHGMTREEAQEAYLVVGRRKRLYGSGDRSEGGRLVHGRKGIGKLAAFGTAGYLECTTLRAGELTSFGIDYDELRRLNPDQNYYVDKVKSIDPLLTPSGEVLEHGTRVRLSRLRVKRQISAGTFQLSMSRRFALREMTVLINGVPLERFSVPLQYRLPSDSSRPGTTIGEDGWGVESLPSGDSVRWWIGFTEKPLAESDQQGVSVLARDKMAQRPFKFERAAGTTAQLGMEYLVGEVEADWLDEGGDIDSDYIQSNRDQLQVENARLDEFMKWGRELLAWSLRERQKLRERDAAATAALDPELDAILDASNAKEKRMLKDIADRIGRLPEVDPGQVKNLMKAVVDSRTESQIRKIAESIDSTSAPLANEDWEQIAEAGRLDAARLGGLIAARLAVLERLVASTRKGAAPEGVGHRVLSDLWLIDPRWHLLGAAVDLGDIGAGSPGTFLAVRPVAPSPQDQIEFLQVVNGRIDEVAEVDRFIRRVDTVRDRFPDAVVGGHLIADDFSEASADSARNYSGALLRVASWSDVFERSLAMHRAWLDLSRRRKEAE